MTLSYFDLLSSRKRIKIKAEITADHPCSSYGQPVIVLDDGNALDLQSWVILNYRVEKASKNELNMLKEVFKNLNILTEHFDEKKTDPAD